MTIHHHGLAFLQKDHGYTPRIIADFLKTVHPNGKIRLYDWRIALKISNWRLYLDFQKESGLILPAASEIPSLFPECPRAAEIAECTHRIDLFARDPDPNMDYFNDFLITTEALSTLPSIIVIDPYTGELV